MPPTGIPSVYRGIGIGESAVFGKLRFINRKVSASPAKYRGKEEELRALAEAVAEAKRENETLRQRTLAAAGGEAAEIFEIHEMLLCDPELIGMAEDSIRKGETAVDAIRRAGESLAAVFEAIEDEYLSARASDMRDVAARVAGILLGEREEYSSDGSPEIIVADDLTPGETAKLDTSRVVGFVTFGGSVNSHTAILARALDIPALIRAEKLPSSLDGSDALLDARKAFISVDPTPEEMLSLAEEL